MNNILPFKIYDNKRIKYFCISYQAKNILCKNKWGFFFSNMIYDLNEIPTIEKNYFNKYNDNLYFYIDFFNIKENIGKNKIYTIHVKINENILKLNNLKAIFINSINKRIFAIADIDIINNKVNVNSNSNTIDILNFI